MRYATFLRVVFNSQLRVLIWTWETYVPTQYQNRTKLWIQRNPTVLTALRLVVYFTLTSLEYGRLTGFSLLRLLCETWHSPCISPAVRTLYFMLRYLIFAGRETACVSFLLYYEVTFSILRVCRDILMNCCKVERWRDLEMYWFFLWYLLNFTVFSGISPVFSCFFCSWLIIIIH